MKKTYLALLLFHFLTGCNNQKITHQETVTKYYHARDAADFGEAKKYINDSITITAGDYIMPYTHASFYEVFKWDSVFKPTYTIAELEEKNNQIIASVALNSVRNAFLKNNDMTCQYKISFQAGKISKIEELDCKNADWDSWQKQRDSLVRWTKNNHPELDGFINDMTMQGALNYVKAIERYEKDKNTL